VDQDWIALMIFKNFADQDWTRAEKFHSQLISGSLSHFRDGTVQDFSDMDRPYPATFSPLTTRRQTTFILFQTGSPMAH